MITARQFYQAWLETIGNNQEKIKQYCHSKSDYTKLAIRDDASLIIQVAKKLGLSCYNADYYSLDSVLYHEQNRVRKGNDRYHYLSHICVAFEHENDFFSGLFQEVAHLLITQSQLKVLVSYPNSFEAKQVNQELAELHSIIADTPDSDEISKKENFLLILGVNKKQHSKDSWKGLIFTTEEWKELLD